MSTRKILRFGALTVSVCALGLIGAVANADIPAVPFEVTAVSPDGTCTVEILAEWGEFDPETGTWSYVQDGELPLMDGESCVAYLTGFDAMIAEDPAVNLNFSVQAGTATTRFHVASALLDFPIISNAQGRASAAVTLTDFDPFDGAANLTGIGDTGGAYLAQYNGWAGNVSFPSGDPDPLGITFAEGINSIVADLGASETETLNVDWTPIAVEDPYDMSALFSFDLTANDLGSGTSNYIIIPEPASLTALLLGGLALLRRRS